MDTSIAVLVAISTIIFYIVINIRMSLWQQVSVVLIQFQSLHSRTDDFWIVDVPLKHVSCCHSWSSECHLHWPVKNGMIFYSNLDIEHKSLNSVRIWITRIRSPYLHFWIQCRHSGFHLWIHSLKYALLFPMTK